MLDRGRLRTLLFAVVPMLVGASMAAARWTHHGPFGSDSDEYRLLADSLWSGSVQIAGVEGTKYPVGYSFVLGLADRIGLPMTGTAVVLNLMAVAALAVLVWHLAARHGGQLPGSVAATALLLSVSLWDSVVLTMPDVLFALVCTAALALVTRVDDPRRLVAVLVLVALGALLKSVAIVLALALAVHLLCKPTRRRLAVLPLGIAILLGGAQAAWSGTEPEHTTGYAATFWLVDPFDASQGSIGLVDLPAAAADRFGDVLRDVRSATFGPQHRSAPAMLLTIALVGVALGRAARPLDVHRAVRRRQPRLPLGVAVPLAALRPCAAAVRSRWRRGRRRRDRNAGGRVGHVVAVIAAVALLVPYGMDAHAEAERHADADDPRNRELERAVAAFDAWQSDQVPADDLMASPLYRELAYRTDRTYVPIPYTLDANAIWVQTHERGVRWYVAIEGTNPARDAVMRGLITTSDGSADLQACFRSGSLSVFSTTPSCGKG